MCDCFSCRLESALEEKEFEEIQKEVEVEDHLVELTDEEQREFQEELYDTFTD